MGQGGGRWSRGGVAAGGEIPPPLQNIYIYKNLKAAGSTEPTGDEDVGGRKSIRCAGVTKRRGSLGGAVCVNGRATECSSEVVMAGGDAGAHMLHQPTASLSGAAAAAAQGGGGTQHHTSHPSVPPTPPPPPPTHILIIHLAFPALLYPPLHPPCLISINPSTSPSILRPPLRRALFGGLESASRECRCSPQASSARCERKMNNTPRHE